MLPIPAETALSGTGFSAKPTSQEGCREWSSHCKGEKGLSYYWMITPALPQFRNSRVEPPGRMTPPHLVRNDSFSFVYSSFHSLPCPLGKQWNCVWCCFETKEHWTCCKGRNWWRGRERLSVAKRSTTVLRKGSR